MPIDPNRARRLDALLAAGLDQGLYLGAVYAIVHGGEIVGQGAVGRQSEAPDRRATVETIFDLASLTKPVATATAILMLAEEGAFHLGEEASAFLPRIEGRALAGVTLRHLLTHTSGLPAWRDFHSHGWGREEIVARVAATGREWPIGVRYVYSDLGYILLGAVVETVSGRGLAAFAEERIFRPLGMRDTGFCPGGERLDRLAATRCPRRGVLRGSVHDENAAAMEGVAGHAGLFGTAGDLARYTMVLLHLARAATCAPTTDHRPSTDLDRSWGPEPAQRASGKGSDRSRPPTTDHRPPTTGNDDAPPPPSPEPRAPSRAADPPLGPLALTAMARNALDPSIGGASLGWFTPPNGMLPAGDFLPPDAFGHTGFTGTSLVVVPSLDLAVILLTNRVYQERDSAPFLRFRRRFHNAVAAAWGE